MWGREGNRAGPKVEEKKVEPNFGLSGALAEETNTVNNVALVYSEPSESAQPTLRWRLYTFKGGQCPSLQCSSSIFLWGICSLAHANKHTLKHRYLMPTEVELKVAARL